MDNTVFSSLKKGDVIKFSGDAAHDTTGIVVSVTPGVIRQKRTVFLLDNLPSGGGHNSGGLFAAGSTCGWDIFNYYEITLLYSNPTLADAILASPLCTRTETPAVELPAALASLQSDWTAVNSQVSTYLSRKVQEFNEKAKPTVEQLEVQFKDIAQRQASTAVNTELERRKRKFENEKAALLARYASVVPMPSYDAKELHRLKMLLVPYAEGYVLVKKKKVLITSFTCEDEPMGIRFPVPAKLIGYAGVYFGKGADGNVAALSSVFLSSKFVGVNSWHVLRGVVCEGDLHRARIGLTNNLVDVSRYIDGLADMLAIVNPSSSYTVSRTLPQEAYWRSKECSGCYHLRESCVCGR